MEKVFHKGHTLARKKYRTKENADYWMEVLDTSVLNDAMINMIGEAEYFFFATSSPDGQPNLNFKGGDKGFLHVIDKKRLVFPDLEGNGILHSMGDLELNSKVSLLIADFNQNARIKIIGRATVVYEDVYVHDYSQYFLSLVFDRLIIIDIDYVIPNCPKNMFLVRRSIKKFDPEKRDPNIIHKLCDF